MKVILLEIIFSGLELSACSDWPSIDPNTHHCLFPIRHFCAYFKYNSKTTACLQLCYTHQTTLLLPRMLGFMLKVAKQLQAISYGLIQTLPSCYLCAIKMDRKTLGTYDFSTQ